jgi:hypothetical protein
MAEAVKRATVYFDPLLHRALRLKAAPDRTVSEVRNEAVRLSLAEDAENLAAFDERAHEPSIAFDKFVTGLRGPASRSPRIFGAAPPRLLGQRLSRAQ